MRQGSVQKNADSKADEKKHLVRGRNKAPKPPRQGLVPAPSQPPPFYGLEGLSRLCYRYLKHLFNCPDSSPDRKRSRMGLLHYIAQILYLSRFNSAVIIMALMLLTRLKHQASPMMVSGHRLFTTALIIASGYLCDNTYRSRSWRDMSGGLFSVEALNTMVREMLGAVGLGHLCGRRFSGAVQSGCINRFLARPGRISIVSTRNVLEEAFGGGKRMSSSWIRRVFRFRGEYGGQFR
ncbi:hypothetical protein DFP72DRAFT_856466 [Ephemerocybe angulata]|uniref:Cyclin N-terminal domain-containing protein n=1 Tax=Ephemerocybe angulata TaxID=980116 RepID=A0A8H6HED5_9AGAR|nr:hypothetical protein DFP72DRAFT_856466 [Tulosesus angulatus]